MSDLSRWPQADDLLERALELAPERRTAFLDSEVDDPELRRALVAVLAEDASHGFLEPGGAVDRPVFLHLEERLDDSVPFPDTIGPYRVLGEIGRGGMARVFLAERIEGGFDQRVALKLVRSGSGREDLRQRFEVERQILARLDHPSIARLFDGGTTTEGQPFFTMELIDGEPIERSCRRRALDLSRRIRVFIEVANAVAYAHRNLVVHRDIKSSNVMVTEDGRVKLLDFGIAKMLEMDRGRETGTHERVMTPEYASPEQLQGDAVTTSSDIYQLGHLLYRLITDRSPYEGKTTTPSYLHAAILTDTPTLPSQAAGADGRPVQWSGALRGDLDAIVMKAMRKEPERRYASVAELIDDLNAFLEARPVKARPDSAGYRMRRFVARHRVPVAIASAATLGLFVLSVFFTLRLAEERDRARREAVEAAQVATFLENLFAVPAPLRSFAAEMTAGELLDEGALRIERELAGQPVLRASLEGVIGSTYRSLMQLDQAEELLERSLETLESQGEPSDRIDALVRLAALRDSQARLDDCVSLLERALELELTETGRDSVPTARILTQLAHCRSQTMRDLDRADTEFDRAFVVLEKALGDEDLEFLSALSHRAFHRLGQSRPDEAEKDFRRLRKQLQRHYGERHPYQVEALSGLAVVAHMRDDPEGALALRREAVALWSDRYGEDHPYVAPELHGLAVSLSQLGQFDEADRAFDRAIRVTRERSPDGMALGYLYYNRSWHYARQDRPERALEELRESLRILTMAAGPESHEVTLPLAALGDMLTENGRFDEAEPFLERAVKVRRRTVGDGHPNVALALESLATLYQGTGRDAESVPVLEEAYTILSDHFGSEHARPRAVASRLAELAASLGRAADEERWKTLGEEVAGNEPR